MQRRFVTAERGMVFFVSETASARSLSVCFSVVAGKKLRRFLEGLGEFSLRFVAYGGGNRGDGVVRLLQELHSPADSVGSHVGGDGLAVDGFEGRFQGRRVDEIRLG